jgi:hypothetical protein
MQIDPPAVANRARHVATEIKQMPITTGRTRSSAFGASRPFGVLESKCWFPPMAAIR